MSAGCPNAKRAKTESVISKVRVTVVPVPTEDSSIDPNKKVAQPSGFSSQKPEISHEPALAEFEALVTVKLSLLAFTMQAIIIDL